MNNIREGVMDTLLRRVALTLAVVVFSAGISFAGDLDKQLAKAIANGDAKKVKTILDQGVDINAKNKEGETALMIASIEGRLKILELLVARGADLNVKDESGATALLYAAMGGSLDSIKFLIKKGADPNVKTKYGDTALSISETKGNHAAVKFLRELEKNGNKQ